MSLYLFGAGTYCTFLVFSQFKDREYSKPDLLSWLVIAIASSFWMLVVPISLIEIGTKAKAQLQKKNTDGVAQKTEGLKEIIIPIESKTLS
jgi:hypothetical protein